jgi:uncharacterized membrane protein (UPF0136 family)
MGWLNPVLVSYSLLNILFGVAGYVSKKSVISLVAGVVAGAIVLGAVALAKSHPKIGYGIAAVVALLLLGRFAGPAFSKQEVYPSGILAAASLIALLALVFGHFLSRNPA